MTDPTTTMPPPGSTTGPESSKAEDVKEQAKEQVQQVAGQAKEQARNVADQAKSQVDQRSTQAGEKVSTHASDLRSVAQSLRQEGKDQPAQFAEQAADRLEKAGNWLTQSDADKILNEIEDFGRQRPWAVIGAGLFLGVAASRMLKASSTQRYETSRSTGSPTTSYPTTSGAPAYTGTGGSMVTPEPRGLPESTLDVPPTTQTPRTGDGTWSGGTGGGSF
jgi:ElaB/YqjD/DUF883 family membrane-anchored ribosome-binding protein